MKKFIVFILFILFCPICFAYNYTEADKNEFYNSFLTGYFKNLELQVKMLPVPETKKQQIYSYVKQNTNKQELINETWGCVQTKEPMNIPGLQQCFAPWGEKQKKKISNYINTNIQPNQPSFKNF